MPTKPIADILDLIGRRLDSAGLQFAHIIGVSFYGSDDLEWLRPLLPDVNAEINYAVLPESERGSAILGAFAVAEV